MGLFSQVKAAVGVGASEVKIAIEEGRYHWGETIRGKVFVSGGQVEQVASQITINITETWIEQRRSHDGKLRSERVYRHHNERFLATQFPIAVGSSHEIAFEVPVPAEGDLDHQWYVAARISVPQAADRHGRADFQLLPPISVIGLVNAVCRVIPCSLNSVSSHSSQITVDLKPGAAHTKDIDGLKLIVHAMGDQVAGVLEINPQEKSFGDRLKALAQQDRVKHQIAFPAQPLAEAGEDGSKVPADMVEHLRTFIAPHLS